MASPQSKRTRSQRVAALKLQPRGWQHVAQQSLSGPNLIRALIVGTTGLLLILIFRGWGPPFPYREGDVPGRDIMARVPFTIVDHEQTQALRDQKRREVLCYYQNDPEPIRRLVEDLIELLGKIDCSVEFDELDQSQIETIELLRIGSPEQSSAQTRETWQLLCRLLREDDLDPGGRFYTALHEVVDPLIEMGVLNTLSHDSDQGSARSIIVLPDEIVVDVSRVRRSLLVEQIPQQFVQKVEQAYGGPEVVPAAQIIGRLIASRLPISTLTYDRERSEQARRRAEASVVDAEVSYYPSVSRLAVAGKPLSRDQEIPLLRAEHETWLSILSPTERAIHLAAFVGMLVAIGMLCGLYIYHQIDQRLLQSPIQLLRISFTITAACLMARWAAEVPVRAEVLPLVMAAMIFTIAFGRQIGLLLATCLSLVVTLGLGLGMVEFVTLAAGSCAASLLLGRIRTRTRLMYVGLMVGCIVMLTHAGVQTVAAVPHAVQTDKIDLEAVTTAWPSLFIHMLQQSARQGGLAILAGALMTGLLPFVEKLYEVQTDLRLLELGDASHPLLRQLAQRAPGTYNHSINVATIAEAAADAIGAHGLLTRVGAYFHDIGKMFKPDYFIENQDRGANSHASLQPAMSTLVIIAHVKDGADLARQHRLPRRIIDFIEQHHGTTLVEYFFREATKRSESSPNKEAVSETSFRYPGPKPQTLEAAVLMLADSVESASRTLVEPTPARIQNLVHDIALKKLLDGQFDQCGLTLRQLSLVEQSLAKSLTAIYHGRIKYPDQASA